MDIGIPGLLAILIFCRGMWILRASKGAYKPYGIKWTVRLSWCVSHIIRAILAPFRRKPKVICPSCQARIPKTDIDKRVKFEDVPVCAKCYEEILSEDQTGDETEWD